MSDVNKGNKIDIEGDLQNHLFSVAENFTDDAGFTWFYRYNPANGTAVLCPEDLRIVEHDGRELYEATKPAVKQSPRGCLRIPDFLNGHVVVGIDIFSFQGLKGGYGENEFTELYLPATVRYIGNFAFRNCKTLVKISGTFAPDKIGAFAFCGCSKLRNVLIGEGTHMIDIHAFEGCTDLQHVWFPESLRIIEDDAFAYCGNLQQVDLPDGIEEVGSTAFMRTHCRITYPEKLGFGFGASTRWRMRTNNPIKRGLFNFLNRENIFKPSPYQ